MWRPIALKCAECATEEGPKVFYLRDFDRVYTNAFYFWLLRGPRGPALIDTGFDIEEGRTFMPSVEGRPDWGPGPRLRALGVDPAEVRHVIVTHLHFDHFSRSARLYPRATFHLQRRELDTYRRPPHPWFVQFYARGVLEEIEGRLAVVDGDAEILPGLTVTHVGGHTPGLQAVLLETGAGRIAMASDLAFQYRNLEEDIPVGLFWNLAEVYSGMEKLRRAAPTVVPGHDPLLETRYAAEKG